MPSLSSCKIFSYRDTAYIFVFFAVSDDNLDWWHIVSTVGLYSGAHAVLQHFHQHIVQMAGHIGKREVSAAVNNHFRSIAVRASAHIRSIVDCLKERNTVKNQTYDVL